MSAFFNMHSWSHHARSLMPDFAFSGLDEIDVSEFREDCTGELSPRKSEIAQKNY